MRRVETKTLGRYVSSSGGEGDQDPPDTTTSDPSDWPSPAPSPA